MVYFSLTTITTIGYGDIVPAGSLTRALSIAAGASGFGIVAILMLEEVNWARWTYLGWGFVNIDYRLYIQTDWHDSVIVIATYLVSALILVLPSANEYFSSEIHYVDD